MQSGVSVLLLILGVECVHGTLSGQNNLAQQQQGFGGGYNVPFPQVNNAPYVPIPPPVLGQMQVQIHWSQNQGGVGGNHQHFPDAGTIQRQAAYGIQSKNVQS